MTFKGAADRAAIEERLLRYVGIHSVNPAIDAGPGEVDLASAVFDDLTALGFVPRREPVHPGGRDNIVLDLAGRPGAPKIMLQAHMDTVGLSGKATAAAESRDGFVYGRGACDTKGSLVATVEAMNLLRELPPEAKANIVFVAGIDEEVTGTGAEKLTLERDDIDMAVVGEPTSLEMATAHKGVLRFEVTTRGKPAHSSKPHLGVSAIHAMARVLDVFEREYMPELAANVHPLVGPATLTVTTISGGTSLNVVPAECTITVDRRVSPGETHDELLTRVDRLLESLDLPGVEIRRSEPDLATSPLDTPFDHPVVQALGRARQTVLGTFGEPIGVTYGTDASFFDPAGIPCVVFGPGSIDQAHSDEEWVGIEETAQAAEVLAELAVELA